MTHFPIFPSPNTIASLLRYAKQVLTDCSESAQLDAEILLAHVLKCSRTQLYVDAKQVVKEEQQQEYLQLLDRRKQHEPIAYITGEKEFWSMMLHVTKDTLIPRPETELLVELTLEKLAQRSVAHVLELGTGSGAIALALAKERPHWQVIATDKSVAALQVAQQNAQRLKLSNITFVASDWFAALDKQRFDAIVSNPPYIAYDDTQCELSVITYEPQSALFAEENGFSDLKFIIENASQYLLSNGWLLLEHGYKQQALITKFFQENNFVESGVATDFSSLPRVSFAKKSR